MSKQPRFIRWENCAIDSGDFYVAEEICEPDIVTHDVQTTAKCDWQLIEIALGADIINHDIQSSSV